MTATNTRTKPPPLSEAHKHSLYVESGISPAVAEERGYATITHRSQLEGEFPEHMRYLGLYVPNISPDGVTRVPQIRPDGRRIGGGAKYLFAKGSTPVLDVHPRNLERISDPSVRLLVTEGAKKGDSATSRGECVISLSGVWGFARKGGAPMPCWDHVALEGRLVYVAYDSDVTTKPEVQQALERLVSFLEGEGANVRVIYLDPAPDGSKVGVDDYLVAGGTVEELIATARTYEPQDFARVRMSRDERLAAMIRELWANWRAMPAVRQGENTRRSIMRSLISLAERRGKPHEEGVRLPISMRELAELAAVGYGSAQRAVKRLEEAGFLRRDDDPSKRKEAAAHYILFARALVDHIGRESEVRESRSTPGNNDSPLSDSPYDPLARGQDVTRFCSTYTPGDPPTRATYAPGVHGARAPFPELRWSSVVNSTELDKRGRRVEVREHLARIGKKRGAVIEYLLEAGGSATVAELMERFAGPKTRRRDFEKRVLSDLAGGGPVIIEIVGEVVSLTSDWRKELEAARNITGEPEAAERQRQKHELQRRAFKNRNDLPEPEPIPDAPKVDDLRRPWAYHPEPCACRECTERFGRVMGEHHPDCKCGECHHARRKGEPRPSPELVEETWLDHPLSCECEECACPAPKYARPVRRAS